MILLKKKICPFFLFITTILHSSFAVRAQSIYNWAKGIGSSGNDYGYSVVTDGSGNVYLAGTFQNTVDFDPGAGTYTLTSQGSNDVFLAKYNSNADFQWVIDIGGPGDDGTGNIVLDASNNVYITGQFSGTASFNPAQTVTVTTQGGQDVFFAKYSSAGTCTWAKGIGGAGSDYYGGIAVDGSGNVAVTGMTTNDPTDFEPGTGNFILPRPAGNAIFNGFTAKYNSNGDCQWVNLLNGSGYTDGRSGSSNNWGSCVVFDAAGNVYNSGAFACVCNFGATTLTAVQDFDTYLVKYNSAGAEQWAKVTGGPYFDAVTGMAIDAANNLYLAGQMQCGGDYDPNAGTAYVSDPANVAKVVTVTLSGTSGTADIHVGEATVGALTKTATFTTDLTTTASDFVTSWASAYAAYGITVTSSGADLIFSTVYKGWDFATGSTVNLTGNLAGSHSVTTTNVVGSANLYFGKYAPDGSYVWVKNLNNGGSYTSAIALNSYGHVYLTGNLTGTCDFDPGAGTANQTSSGGSADIFSARYSNSGGYMGSFVFGAAGTDEGYGIALDNSGNLYLSGVFQNTVDFDPGAGTANLVSSGGTRDAFFAKYSAGFMPVELTSFTGTSENGTVILNWSTASETNTDYFEVQRSSDAQAYTSLGSVKALENSSSLYTYQFSDIESPLPATDPLYYRLKQTDRDGKFTYLGPIAVQMNGSTGLIVYPDPASELLHIIPGDAWKEKHFRINIFDAAGAVHFSGNCFPETGKNEILINLYGWSKGLYILSAETENGMTARKKIVKL